ncbi:MAG: hypothetical protein LBV08_06725, partial [Clostridiales bacterium]|nr:hypothetical protein [Clostridiales bacterium]
LYCNQVYVFAEGSYLDIIGYINDIQKNGDRYYLSGLDIRTEYDYYKAEISINIYTYITNPIENRPKTSAEK